VPSGTQESQSIKMELGRGKLHLEKLLKSDNTEGIFYVNIWTKIPFQANKKDIVQKGKTSQP